MAKDSLAVGVTVVLGALLSTGPAAAWGPAPSVVLDVPAAPADGAAPAPGAPASSDATPPPDAQRAAPAAPDAEPEAADARAEAAAEARAAARAEAAAEARAAARAEADAALKRVLASGCRDGLVEVDDLVGDASAPWARTVLRLCGEVLSQSPRFRTRTPAVLADSPRARRARDGTRDGRGQMVFWSGLYGAWLGVATDALFEIGGRAVILPPMLGMASGLTASLVLTSERHVTAGEAWTIITGLDYGSINGALWAGGLGFTAKGTIGTSVASSFVATAVGLAVADARSPSAGQIEVCRSGLLWGTIGGMLAVAALAPDTGPSGRTVALAGAIGMDAGFLAGLAVARRVDVSKNRALIIDAGALGGALFGLGAVWLAVGQTSGHGHEIAGGGFVGLASGIAVAALATRKLDANPDPWAAGTPSFPALVARDGDGRWRPGAPAPAPVLDPTGSRLAGASLNAVGGLF